MHLALRDIAFAKGRFALIGAVVALISLLVGMLAGLTGGLASQNISALRAIDAQTTVIAAGSDGQKPSFDDSSLTRTQADEWTRTAGVSTAVPLGISRGSVSAGEARTSVAVFGGADAAPEDGEIVLPKPTADDLGIAPGDAVNLLGAEFTVSRVEPVEWYTHSPVVRISLADWQAAQTRTGSPDAYATALLVPQDAPVPDAAAVERADGAADTVSSGVWSSLLNITSFRSEIGSLLTMLGLLFGISALVVGAFFSVWTHQRQGDIAVLKALGASTGSLLRDALGQALLVLVLGAGLGFGLTAALGMLIGSAVPFAVSWLTTLVPALLLVVLGALGSATSLCSITKADPLTALGAAR